MLRRCYSCTAFRHHRRRFEPLADPLSRAISPHCRLYGSSVTAMRPAARNFPIPRFTFLSKGQALPRCSVFSTMWVQQDYGGPVGFRMAVAHPERVCRGYHPDACRPTRKGLVRFWLKPAGVWPTGLPTKLGLRANSHRWLRPGRRAISARNLSPQDMEVRTAGVMSLLSERSGEERHPDRHLFYDYRTNVRQLYRTWGLRCGNINRPR